MQQKVFLNGEKVGTVQEVEPGMFSSTFQRYDPYSDCELTRPLMRGFLNQVEAEEYLLSFARKENPMGKYSSR